MPTTQHTINDECCSIVDLLGTEYGMILDKISELETLAMRLDKENLEADLYLRIFKINNYIYTELIKYFNSEEDYLFKELSHYLPDPSSTTVMKDEHFEVLRLCNLIQNYLGDEDTVQNRKDEIQGLIYCLAGLLRRHVQRKNIMLHHEVCSLIPDDVMNYLYYEMYKKTHGANF